MDHTEVELDLFSSQESSEGEAAAFPESSGFDFMKDIENLMEKVYGTVTEYKPYDIGRNDPCPCGSGKKYKKCCGRIRAEQSADYYIEKISETENLDQAYEIIKEAEKNHPLNIGFIVQLILISGKKENLEEVEAALLKLWRLLGTEMGENLTAMLLSLLINSDRYEELIEIEKDLKMTEIKNADLLLFLSMTKIMQAEEKAGLDFLYQALNSSRLPDTLELLVEIMKFFYEKEEYQVLYNIWLDNFERFKELEEKFGRGELPMIAVLKAVLFDTFALDKETNFNSKTLVKKYSDNFLKLQQNIEAISDQSSKSEIDSILRETEESLEELAFESTLYLMLLERLIGSGYYSKALDYIEKGEKVNAEESEFLMFKARANYYLENYDVAEKSIEKALFNFEDKAAFNKLTVLGDKLLILIAQNNYQQIFELLSEIKNESQMPLLSAVAKSLAPHSTNVTLNLFKEMLELPENELIDQKKLYLNIFYYLFIKRDQQKLKVEEIGAEFKAILNKMPAKYDSQLSQLAALYLKNDDLSREERLKELMKINKQPAEFTEEAQIKFEDNLRLENYEYILNEEYFAEEKELLLEGDFAFYKFIALVNSQAIEAGLSFLKSLSEEQSYNLYERIMREGDTFLAEEKVLTEMEDKGLFETIY